MAYLMSDLIIGSMILGIAVGITVLAGAFWL